MRKGVLLLIVTIFAVSCSNKPDAPDKLLAPEKMEDVLWDMMRADLFISNYMVIKDTALNKKKQGLELYTQILKIHRISQEQFRESFLYYRSQPLELKVLMDSLSHRNDSLQVQKPTKKPDSVSKVQPEKPLPATDTIKRKKLPRAKAE